MQTTINFQWRSHLLSETGSGFLSYSNINLAHLRQGFSVSTVKREDRYHEYAINRARWRSRESVRNWRDYVGLDR